MGKIADTMDSHLHSRRVEWFKDVYNPIRGKISIVALPLTLVVLFSLRNAPPNAQIQNKFKFYM
jgi:ACR3 family arsenite efflux pump ArsB